MLRRRGEICKEPKKLIRRAFWMLQAGESYVSKENTRDFIRLGDPGSFPPGLFDQECRGSCKFAGGQVAVEPGR